VNAQTIVAKLEAAVEQQLVLSGSDPAVEAAARALLAVLEPSLKEVTTEMAEAAAAEVASQLPDHRVQVVLEEGDPYINVRPMETEERFGPSDYEARVTVRLPDSLKELVERAADGNGDSVNTWIVKALSSKTRRGRGNRVSGTYEI